MGETSGMLDAPGGRRLAYRRLEGRGTPVIWLGGFASDMTGTKAQALAGWAVRAGRPYVRFDYSGHGASEGRFRDGSISDWREDSMAALDQLVDGKAVLVGSSMGAWLACLVALARPERIKALVLLAPAVDFTSKLLWPRLPTNARETLELVGEWPLPSSYEAKAIPLTSKLMEDGKAWSILPGPVPIGAPVRVLQGQQDPDVPWRHAVDLFQAIESSDGVFSLIKDGDHRLSRPRDIFRMISAVEEVSI